MSAVGYSNYKVLQIAKPERGIVVDTRGRVVGFDYYESVYSPMVTASMTEIDAGGTVTNTNGIRGTLKDALPIEGNEDVFFNISTAYKDLNFTKTPMKTLGSPLNIDANTKQVTNITMVSKYAFDNANTTLSKVYQEAPISDVVEKILDELNVPKDKRDIEKTSTLDKVVGNHEPPLDVILGLCKKSTPANGKDPGYFFFETQDGFKFKSIDTLINEGIESFKNDDYRDTHTYYYFTSPQANLDNDTNDFKVLFPPVVKRDQNKLQAIKHGQFNCRICTINTLTQEYDEKIVNLLSNSNLGKKQKNTANSKNFSKSYTYVVNPGANEKGVSEQVINSPSSYEPMANMRYSLLHAQLVDIQIPCNALLQAGDVIKLMIENITQDNKLDQINNEHRSGYYLILHLCHHFDSSNSFTSLTLARDTYGLYRSTK